MKSIAIPPVTNTGENVVFEDDIPCLVILHSKKEVLEAINLCSSVIMDRCTRYCVNQSGDA
jgi:hypothetical protein